MAQLADRLLMLASFLSVSGISMRPQGELMVLGGSRAEGGELNGHTKNAWRGLDCMPCAELNGDMQVCGDDSHIKMCINTTGKARSLQATRTRGEPS